MKILIAGSGAMGSRFGIMLHRAGNQVVLVDGWQEHIDNINRDGLKANFDGEELVEKITAVNQKEVAAIPFEADLIVVFTKSMQLEQMMKDIQAVIHDETSVLCLMNGIGHEEVIEKYVPKKNIFLGNTMWTAGMSGPGAVKLFGNGSVVFQNLDGGQQDKADKIIEVLNKAELNAEYSDNILYAIYKKACVNGTMNGLCTILDTNMAGFGETSPANNIVTEIVEEFRAIAAQEGIALDKEEVLNQIVSCYNRETIGLHHPSMYQDLIENHRLTEIDYINGAIVRKGEKYGIDTPYCRFLTQLVHAKEEILGAH